MKKIIFYLLGLILSCLSTYAQSTDQVLARVHYAFTNKKDTLNNGKIRSENMFLFVGKNASLYSSFDKVKHEVSDEQKYSAMLANKATNNRPTVIIVDDKDSKWMTSSTYLFFIKENKFFSKEVIALEAYLVEESAPKINWKISKDTLSFSGLKCQKATANFEGKNWIAWFAPTLPFQSGPWKLNGLPGLIVAAYDENEEVKFQFSGFENAKEGDHARIDDITKKAGANSYTFNPIDQMIGRDVGNAYFENVIRLPIGAIKISKEKLEKLQIAFKKDPKGFVRARSGY